MISAGISMVFVLVWWLEAPGKIKNNTQSSHTGFINTCEAQDVPKNRMSNRMHSTKVSLWFLWLRAWLTTAFSSWKKKNSVLGVEELQKGSSREAASYIHQVEVFVLGFTCLSFCPPTNGVLLIYGVSFQGERTPVLRGQNSKSERIWTSKIRGLHETWGASSKIPLTTCSDIIYLHSAYDKLFVSAKIQAIIWLKAKANKAFVWVFFFAYCHQQSCWWICIPACFSLLGYLSRCSSLLCPEYFLKKSLETLCSA